MLASATAAAFLGQPVWAAAAGAGLVVVHWALEALTVRLASRGPFGHSVAIAVGGAAARMALALLCLVIIGIAARDAFATAALAFAAALTVYTPVRVAAFGAPPTPSAEGRPR